MDKRYKHIFFDLDHTLWDFNRNSAATLSRIYKEYNLVDLGITDEKDFFDRYTKHSDMLWARFRTGTINREALRWKRFWLTLLDYKIGDSALAHELSTAYLEILPTQTLLTPYSKEILDYCQEDYTMHLITNGFDTTQKMKLHFSGIAQYFSEIITSEKSNSMKPKPGIFEFALETTGATIEESIMIGDAIDVDILGASNAGWDQVYYNPEKIKHDRKPTYEVHCMSELKSIL